MRKERVMKVSLDLNEREVEEVMEKYDDMVEKVDRMMLLLQRISDHIEKENHYKLMMIQPTEYILANNLDWCEANIVKSMGKERGRRIRLLRNYTEAPERAPM
jgi:hypothetical protein